MAGYGQVLVIGEDAVRIDMLLDPVVVAITVADFLLAEVRNLHRLAFRDGASQGLDARQRHIGCRIYVPRRFLTRKNLPRKIIQFPEIAAAMACAFRDGTKIRPVRIDVDAVETALRADLQLQFRIRLRRRARSEKPLVVAVRGRAAHQIAHNSTVAHVDQRRTHGAQIRHDAVDLAALPMDGPFVQDIRRKRDDLFRPQARDDHDRPERMGAIIMVADPAAPMVQAVAGQRILRVQTGMRPAMDVFVFRIFQFAEEAFLVQFRQIHVGLRERIVFREIIHKS